MSAVFWVRVEVIAFPLVSMDMIASMSTDHKSICPYDFKAEIYLPVCFLSLIWLTSSWLLACNLQIVLSMSSRVSNFHQDFQTFEIHLIKFVSVWSRIITCKPFRDNASSILLLLPNCCLCVYVLSGISPASTGAISKGTWFNCE